MTFDLSTTHPLAVVVVALALLLLGGFGSRGFVRANRHDKQQQEAQRRTTEAELFDKVREIVKEEVEHVQDQLRTERRRTARLEKRVEQLTEILRGHNIPVPSWPTALRVVGDDVTAQE